MKRILLLVLLAGCGTGGLPRLSIPDTRAITEFKMGPSVRQEIGEMYILALQEGVEHASCLWGKYSPAETESEDFKSDSYYAVVFDSIAPARTLGATFNTVTIAEGGPCDELAIATIHTHLRQGVHSNMDLVVFLMTSQHIATFVVDDIGVDPNGIPVAELHYVMRHGSFGTWIIPLTGGGP